MQRKEGDMGRKKFLHSNSSSNFSFTPKSYDIVGDIAIVKASFGNEKKAQEIADAITIMSTNIKTVLKQETPIAGDFRLRKLKYIAGQCKTNTVHKEYGCKFLVDLEKCYFSPRLSYERFRIAKLVKAEETIVNMFAGVGCFSLLIAKQSDCSKIFSIDMNPDAIELMKENIRLNRVFGKVTPILGDAKIVSKKLLHTANRILMPLPERAFEYLPFALSMLKQQGGWIHYYDFEHSKSAEIPTEKTKRKVEERLSEIGALFEIEYARIIRSTGPNWNQVVLDIRIDQAPDRL